MAPDAAATMDDPIAAGTAMSDEEVAAQAQAEQDRADALAAKADAIVGRLTRLAEQQVGQRQSIEDQWLEDLRQYYGRYNTTTEAQLKDANKSRMFVKLTRTKTHAWEARISDLLFPTDEKNWGIKPTPLPTLAQAARDAEAEMEKAVVVANTQAADGDAEAAASTAAAADEFAKAKSHAEGLVAEAKRRAELMERQIDDQLVECRYPVRCRDVIRDGCKLGTGIIKGPMVANRNRKVWAQGVDGRWALNTVPDPNPEFLRTDPWHFFPDMSAREIDEAEFTFERHLLTTTQLKALGRQPDFDKDALAAIVREGSKSPVPTYMTELRSISGISESIDARFLMWEYHGPLEHDEVCDILELVGDTEMLDALESDPLAEYRVILFFCNHRLLKCSLHPLDSGETLYSVFNFEKDDASVFGVGIPRLMSDSQAALNGAWRMIMDNAGLSVGPQVVIDKSQITPANGDWTMTPRKVWWKATTTLAGAAPPFDIHNIPNAQAELTNIITLSRQFADDETNMPLIAQGEQASHVTPTMGGMSILMNSANVVFRRIIKMFDDCITTPNLRRIYDWNMQFNPDDSIKGDMTVDARGSSVLLVREVQATNLMQITNNWSGNPLLGPLLKLAPAMRKTVQALMISADEIIMSDDEIAAMVKAKANEKAPPSPDEVKLQVAQLDAETRLKVAEGQERIATLNHQGDMMRLAEERNMTTEQVQAMLEGKKLEVGSKERIMAAEVGAEAQKAQQAADLGQPDTGSGGYI